MACGIQFSTPNHECVCVCVFFVRPSCTGSAMFSDRVLSPIESKSWVGVVHGATHGELFLKQLWNFAVNFMTCPPPSYMCQKQNQGRTCMMRTDDGHSSS